MIVCLIWLLLLCSQGQVISFGTIDGYIYAFDSTSIELCLNVFRWAEFRKAKCDIKMHTLYDVENRIPNFVYITSVSVNDINAMVNIQYERDCYYIFNWGWTIFEWLRRINKLEAYFVLPARNNLKFYRMQPDVHKKSWCNMRTCRNFFSTQVTHPISRKATSNQVLWDRNKGWVCLFDKQFWFNCNWNRVSVQESLACGAVFQVDETTF